MCRWHYPYGREPRRTKEPLDEREEESEKVGLKLNIQKTKIMASGPITVWQIYGKTVETVADFILGGSKITADGDCSHEIKRHLLFEKKSYHQPRQHIKQQRHYFASMWNVCQGCMLSSCLFNFYAEYIVQNARLDKAPAGIKIVGRNINNFRYTDDTTFMAESEEELKSLLMKLKEESEKADLKLNIQKTKIMAAGPITPLQIDGETMETVTDFILGGSKITADGDCSH